MARYTAIRSVEVFFPLWLMFFSSPIRTIVASSSFVNMGSIFFVLLDKIFLIVEVIFD